MSDLQDRGGEGPLGRGTPGERIALWSILMVSAVGRLVLAARGGQFFRRDEGRFRTAQAAVEALVRGHFREMYIRLFAPVEHTLFNIIALIPAAILRLGASDWMTAGFFGLFSTGSIYLVWSISLRTSRRPREALYAAAAAAASTSLFYYSRHNVPYDVALFFLFGGLRLSLDNRRCALFSAGILSALGFLIYNGYGVCAGAGLFVGALYSVSAIGPFLRRAAVLAAGFVVVLGLTAFLQDGAGGHLRERLQTFSQTVVAGNFSGGWRFPWEYFWSAEHGLLLAWLAALGWAAVVVAKGRWGYLRYWLGAIVAISGALEVLSDFAHQFVLYGRIVRCLVPFFSLVLGAACYEASVGPRWLRRSALVIVLAIGAQAGWQWRAVFAQKFPREFRRSAQDFIASRPWREQGDWHAFTTLPLQPALREFVAGVREVRFSTPHPLQFGPYLFEGYNRQQRDYFREFPAEMVLAKITLHSGASRPWRDPRFGPQLGPLRIAFTSREGARDTDLTLVDFGPEGARSRIFLRRRGFLRQAQVVYEQSQAATVESEWFPFDGDSPHVAEISLGTAMAAEGSSLYRQWPQLRSLRSRLFFRLDGRVLLNRVTDTYPVAPGPNRGSTAGRPARNATGTTGAPFSFVEPIDPLELEEELFETPWPEWHPLPRREGPPANR